MKVLNLITYLITAKDCEVFEIEEKKNTFMFSLMFTTHSLDTPSGSQSVFFFVCFFCHICCCLNRYINTLHVTSILFCICLHNISPLYQITIKALSVSIVRNVVLESFISRMCEPPNI